MNLIKINKLFKIAVVVSCMLFFFSSCMKNSLEGMVVFTQVQGDLEENNFENADFRKYIPNAQIAAINAANTTDSYKVLSKDFFSAMAPEISYDGKFMLFSGQKQQHDTWQIWEMNLENLSIRQITNVAENCTDPAYLPNEKIVFSKQITNDVVKNGHALFTSNINGSEMIQITYNPHNYISSTVLKDGRILTKSSQLYPTNKKAAFMVLRPDGSKSEMFYQPSNGNTLFSNVRELTNGKIIFVESDSIYKKGSNIVVVNYNNPLHSRVNFTSKMSGYFFDATSFRDDKLMVSYRKTKNEKYSLFEFDIKNKKLGKAIYEDESYHILEAITVEKSQRPKKLPSDIDNNATTGILLGQDINFTEIPIDGENVEFMKAIKMELLGTNSSLGIIDVEKDGSFYVKVLANTPFRIQTLDKEGNIVNGPSSWLYVRPNERRGCIGCHENREQVPKNIQPLSARKKPIILPEYLNKTLNNSKN
jgi:hypothetical protein